MTPEQEVLAQGLMGMQENMRLVLEAAAGYKAECKKQGFGDIAADQMAADYHRHLLGIMFSGVKM